MSCGPASIAALPTTRNRQSPLRIPDFTTTHGTVETRPRRCDFTFGFHLEGWTTILLQKNISNESTDMVEPTITVNHLRMSHNDSSETHAQEGTGQSVLSVWSRRGTLSVLGPATGAVPPSGGGRTATGGQVQKTGTCMESCTESGVRASKKGTRETPKVINELSLKTLEIFRDKL